MFPHFYDLPRCAIPKKRQPQGAYMTLPKIINKCTPNGPRVGPRGEGAPDVVTTFFMIPPRADVGTVGGGIFMVL